MNSLENLTNSIDYEQIIPFNEDNKYNLQEVIDSVHVGNFSLFKECIMLHSDLDSLEKIAIAACEVHNYPILDFLFNSEEVTTENKKGLLNGVNEWGLTIDCKSFYWILANTALNIHGLTTEKAQSVVNHFFTLWSGTNSPLVKFLLMSDLLPVNAKVENIHYENFPHWDWLSDSEMFDFILNDIQLKYGLESREFCGYIYKIFTVGQLTHIKNLLSKNFILELIQDSKEEYAQNKLLCGELLVSACNGGKLETVKYLLTDTSCPIKPLLSYNSGRSLGSAVSSGNLDLVKYLLTSPELKEHAYINSANGYPLLVASMYINTEIIKYLLSSPELSEHAYININNCAAFRSLISHKEMTKDCQKIADYFLYSPDLMEHIDVNLCYKSLFQDGFNSASALTYLVENCFINPHVVEFEHLLKIHHLEIFEELLLKLPYNQLNYFYYEALGNCDLPENFLKKITTIRLQKKLNSSLSTKKNGVRSQKI